MPLTHTHGESGYERADAGKEKKTGGKGCFTAILTIVLAIIIFSVIFSTSNELKNEVETKIHSLRGYGSDEGYSYEEIDPYENLTAELPPDGESVTHTLPTGRYVVGVHIPAGNYVADVQGDFDVVQVNDFENGIYLYEYRGKEEENHLDDLRLFPGAVVQIEANDVITLSTDNGQTADMTSMTNPLTQSYDIRDAEIKKAGRDFEAGVYDVELVSDAGGFSVSIYDENDALYVTDDIYLDEDGSEGKCYKNLILPEDAEITLEEGLEIRLTPSEIIESTEYLKAYIY